MYSLFFSAIFCISIVPSLAAQSITTSLKSEILSILIEQHSYKGWRIYNGNDTLVLKDTLERFKEVLQNPAFPSFENIHFLSFTDHKNARVNFIPPEEKIQLLIPVDTPTESFIPLISSQLSFVNFYLEVKKLMKENHRFNGNLKADTNVDNKQFAQGLEGLKKALETTKSVPSFKRAKEILFTNTTQLKISSNSYLENLIDINIPFDIAVDSFIPLLSARFLKWEVEELLQKRHGFNSSTSIRVANDIDNLELIEILQRFKAVLETSNFVLNFKNIKSIAITNGKSVRTTRLPIINHSIPNRSYYSLNIPVTTSMESLIPILTQKFSVIQLQQEIQKILHDEYQAQSNPLRFTKSRIDDETFQSELEKIKKILQANNVSVSFENVRYISITNTDTEGPWTRPYHDNSVALYIPAKISENTLAPLIETALFSIDELENKVYEQLQIHNYRGPPVTNHPDRNVDDYDYKKGLANLWVILKSDKFIPDFGLVNQLWITKRGQRTRTLSQKNHLTLILSSETPRESLMSSIDIAIHGGPNRFLAQIERTLKETFHSEGLVVRSWSVNSDEIFIKGLKALLTVLERQDVSLNLNAVNRFVITGNQGTLWTFSQENNFDVYIPADVTTPDLIRFLSQL